MEKKTCNVAMNQKKHLELQVQTPPVGTVLNKRKVVAETTFDNIYTII